MECELVLYLEEENINIYSFRNANEEKLELEKFLEKFPSGSKYSKDMNIILAAIKKIIKNGSLERYFRPEGSYADGVGAIPIEGNKLRLYCIRISDSIIVFGNGDVKKVSRWQDCPVLAPYVMQLKNIQIEISKAFKKNILEIENQKYLKGTLKFNIE